MSSVYDSEIVVYNKVLPSLTDDIISVIVTRISSNYTL